MLREDIKVDMEKVCRSCLRENEKMRNLFDNRKNEDTQSLQLAEMIMACTSVQVHNGDSLPKLLCDECEIKLIVAYDFKLLCEKSDYTLREIEQEKNGGNIYDDGDHHFMENSQSIDYDSEEKKTSDDEDHSFKCLSCPKMFGSQKGLRLHQKSHKGSKHMCNECGVGFVKAVQLNKHKKLHKSELDAVKHEDVSLMEDYEYQSVSGDKKDRQYECEVCHKILTTYVGLKIHMKRHTGVNLYGCNVCEKTFTKSSHVKRHMRSGHGLEYNGQQHEKSLVKKVMECEFCDRKFKYRKSFNHHMQTEHGMEENDSDTPLSKLMKSPEHHSLEPKIEIDVDDEGLEVYNMEDPDNPDDLETKEPRRAHTCHVCESQFSRSNHLTRHMTLHRAVLTHKCDLCDKAFASQDFLDKHKQEDHINKPYTCTICNRTFTRGEHLIRHLKVHLPNEKSANTLKCSVCMKEYSRADHLARHIKVHLQHDKRHVCNECGKAFNRLDNLKTHQRIHTGQKDISKLHLCVYCGKEFNNSSNMIVHMRRHTGERPYKCNQCGKGFPRSHDLKCHERTHSGEKPYLCTLCGKSFNKSNKLLRHTRVHTGERPYVCNICGRAFTQSNDLALHMRRHTGSRPYACGVCPARFIQSGQLKTHRRSSGHWMDTQPDLKGGHRVEPVVLLTEPAPIKFKTHGKTKHGGDDDSPKEDGKPEADSLVPKPIAVGYVPSQDERLRPLLVDTNKILAQFPHLNSFTTAVNSNFVIHADASRNTEEEGKVKLVSNAPTFQVYTSTSTTSTFTNTESFNYQTYG